MRDIKGKAANPIKSATADTGVVETGAATSGTEAALDATERLAGQMREGGAARPARPLPWGRRRHWTRANGSPGRCARAGREAGAAAASGVQRRRCARAPMLPMECRSSTTAWARYAEEIMRQTSEASRALLNCRSFGEMLEVQAQLLRGNLQTFLDQSGKIAYIAGRMAARPLEALSRGRGQRRS